MGKELILELAMATNLPLEYSLKRITELVHRQGLNMDTISQRQVELLLLTFYMRFSYFPHSMKALVPSRHAGDDLSTSLIFNPHKWSVLCGSR